MKEIELKGVVYELPDGVEDIAVNHSTGYVYSVEKYKGISEAKYLKLIAYKLSDLEAKNKEVEFLGKIWNVPSWANHIFIHYRRVVACEYEPDDYNCIPHGKNKIVGEIKLHKSLKEVK